MPETYPFDPDWCMAPGVHLEEWIEENLGPAGKKGGGPRLLAAMTARPEHRERAAALFQSVLDREPIDELTARFLQAATRIPSRMWLNLEKNYRDALVAGKVDISDS